MVVPRVVATRANLVDEGPEEALEDAQATGEVIADLGVVKVAAQVTAYLICRVDAVFLDFEGEVLPEHAAVGKQVKDAARYLAVVILARPVTATC